MKGAGERAELLRRQMKFGLQRCCQYGRDGPEGLAHRERGRQRQQHDPGPGMPGRGALSGHHAASVAASLLFDGSANWRLGCRAPPARLGDLVPPRRGQGLAFSKRVTSLGTATMRARHASLTSEEI